MVQGFIQKGGEGFYQEGAGWAFAPPPLRNQNGNGHVGSCPPKNIQIVLLSLKKKACLAILPPISSSFEMSSN